MKRLVCVSVYVSVSVSVSVYVYAVCVTVISLRMICNAIIHDVCLRILIVLLGCVVHSACHVLY
jgi:hypothetical protein